MPDRIFRRLRVALFLACAALPRTGAVADAEAAADPAAVAREQCRRLGKSGPPWSDREILAVLEILVGDPRRFASDPGFRESALEQVVRAFPPDGSGPLRDRLLERFNALPGVDFAASERIELAWGAARRSSLAREVPYSVLDGRVVGDLEGPIVASVFSLPATMLDVGEIDRLLKALRRLAPRRTLLVLTDAPAERILTNAADVQLLASRGRRYSPWPRDPFLFRRREDGRVSLVVRPYVQPGRELDNAMGLELLQELPEALDRAWGRPTWSRAPVPFHNGHVWVAPSGIWLGIHALEPRILERTGLDRVPVDRLHGAEGWREWRREAIEAARELAALYGRPASWVHPLPPENEAPDAGTLAALGGGAGWDLDSIVTILLDPRGDPAALVGDPRSGRTLLRDVSSAERESFVGLWGIRPSSLHEPLAPRAEGLAAYLDLVASHLGSLRVAVERIPLVHVPAHALIDERGAPPEGFLVSWNNVVFEVDGKSRRAEGFSGGIPSGDRRAREVFGRLGYGLDLLPPLTASVRHNGGYRCASQHLR